MSFEPDDLWEGPVTYTEDPKLVDRPGHYALKDDHDERGHKLLLVDKKPVRVKWIEGDPDDDWDLGGEWVVADPDEPLPEPENVVDLEAEAHGTSSVEA